ncbi:hypothetical protein BJ986_003141 [Phycicoccus badiiscoriae]|uniref:Uncharacterized protein n=1 Tax=Pedococcus badiiscoriae TaxID=642776 RepID=A0A852WP54_9MICO|nr:hypothetical protein [Pedococcus badiiscoriae]NYG08654.1 hypothetical protein [Pedococcus badiiscoriae]
MIDATPPASTSGRTAHTLDARGFIRDWLVSPAWSSPCDDLDEVLASDGSPWGPQGRWVLTNGPDVAPLKRVLYQRHALLTDQPLPEVVEHGELSWTRSAGDTPSTGGWQRVHTGRDGLVDWSQFCFTPEYRHAVAATTLEVDQAEYRVLEVSSTGPVAVFVAGELLLATDDFGYMDPITHRLRVRLESGTTSVVVASWQVAFREVRQVLAVRVEGLPVRVVIPSPGSDEHHSRYAEQLLDSVGVGPWAAAEGTTTVTGPRGARLLVSLGDGPTQSLVLEGGRAILDLTRVHHDPDSEGAASMLSTGESELTLRVDRDDVPIFRTARIATLPPRRRDRPESDDPQVWRREFLEHSAGGVPGTARALAREALKPGQPLDPADLETPLRMIGSRYDCADFEAVGLVHLWRRLPDECWTDDSRARVRDALTTFKYWIDQPGLDAMCYFTENHQFVWHTAELLVGEMFADETFSGTGWTGRQHAEHAYPLAQEWIRRKLAGGFSEFDSNAYLAIDCFALVSLVEFAESQELRHLAEALLDKCLLTLATNSWKGVHGAAHGRSYTHTLRSGRFEETAPIMWLLWGVGALNDATLPATSLATAEHYSLPPVIRSLAQQPPEEWDGRQVYRGEYRLHHDLLERPYGSDLRVWRTPDAMLSSVQDYRSGLPGLQEHIWGATLDSEIQVFATHPAADTISASARPNSWAGQLVLPRAHQDRDTVLVLHRIPDHDWIGTTHVWFPAELFDEWQQVGSWLAGRVGDGYVAIATAGGLRPQLTDDESWQSWWPNGDGRSYVATVGRRAVDGPFADFVAALSEPTFDGSRDEPAVGWTARDGRVLHVAWSQPFTVDGRPSALGPDGRLETPPHLANPACRQEFGAASLEVEWEGEKLLIDYQQGRRLEPASGVAASLREAGGQRDGR